jgi:membrane carboxypeptidase/penicillin-binding protein PbpC
LRSSYSGELQWYVGKELIGKKKANSREIVMWQPQKDGDQIIEARAEDGQIAQIAVTVGGIAQRQ